MTEKKKKAIIDNYIETKILPTFSKEAKEGFVGGWREMRESSIRDFLEYLIEKKLLISNNRKTTAKEIKKTHNQWRETLWSLNSAFRMWPCEKTDKRKKITKREFERKYIY